MLAATEREGMVNGTGWEDTGIWFGDNYRIKARAFALAPEKMEAWRN